MVDGEDAGLEYFYPIEFLSDVLGRHGCDLNLLIYLVLTKVPNTTRSARNSR